MAYETLIREAQNLPEDVVEQTLMFMRFLRLNSVNSVSSSTAFSQTHRSANPLAEDFISISDDFDATPDCFSEYM